jgi:hypothetical protein
LFAQEAALLQDELDADETRGMPNLLSQTAGGVQFWTDVWFFHDWRIQQNALTGHHRLLDGRDRRHAWGSFATCRESLDAIRQRDVLPAMSGKAVVVLHGLLRTRRSMRPLCRVLSERGGYSVFNMGYPTTRRSIGEHAGALASVITSLEGMGEVNFVCQSMGNLVVRRWLHDLEESGRKLPDGQALGRMVMLGPPNQHPVLAEKLLSTDFAQFFTGPASQELSTGWETLQPSLATPSFEFGIIAGGKGDGRGYNPLIPGDDDGIVAVESTHLAGARDYRLVRVLHSLIMNHERVQEYTLRFLKEGHFEDQQRRHPLT